jgi:hypothetical protein
MADLAKERVSYKKNMQATAATRSICLSLRCLTAPQAAGSLTNCIQAVTKNDVCNIQSKYV